MKPSDKHLEELAVATHASLLTLHALAVLFHFRRKDGKKWPHITAHAAGAVYSGLSLARHISLLKEDK